ncbi:MAG: ABC-ATPase domain-containing protein [Candidatus Kapabacteria bacterium]|nr:ABC-ATPase domain-containing protein [Candidatus Kapabacteria bacterium]MDW8012206.1 ABC-ATPase domain-containing protein [Bacteroidota bacterium]
MATRTVEDLRRILQRIDGRGYKAYDELEGEYRFPQWTLWIDHVQPDPFAPPSRMRLRLPQSVARFPEELFADRVRRIALEDYLARRVRSAIDSVAQKHRGSGKSGLISVDAGNQEVLERTAVRVTAEWVELRFQLGLPAAGRTVLGRQAEAMLRQELPEIVRRSLLWEMTPQEECRRFVECIENQEFIRRQLQHRGLVAFVADGAILPRRSGISQLPLPNAIPFRSPASLRVSFTPPNPVWHNGQLSESITGMGIPEGVTLIVGGGYHGKSTLLRALERGVYPHIPGDGREYVVTRADAVKIRAEDGRRIEQVDLSPFIGTLPYGQSTHAFCTDNASGSTSQAANIVEALEAGSRLLLIDEDTSATNFMVRDARMQALVAKDYEPITPFVDRVRELFERFRISTVLVMGGSGDYLDVADTVIMMREYCAEDVTEQARAVAAAYPTGRRRETPAPFERLRERALVPESIDTSRGRREVSIDAKSTDLLVIGTTPVELWAVEQLVDISQTRAIGYAIHTIAERYADGRKRLAELLDAAEQLMDTEALEALSPFARGGRHPGNLARPRRYEIAAALNRLRTVRMRQV